MKREFVALFAVEILLCAWMVVMAGAVLWLALPSPSAQQVLGAQDEDTQMVTLIPVRGISLAPSSSVVQAPEAAAVSVMTTPATGLPDATEAQQIQRMPVYAAGLALATALYGGIQVVGGCYRLLDRILPGSITRQV